MTPTILIVGATGNTGRKVVETLPALLKKSKSLSSHRILCLTRSLQSDSAKRLSQVPGIELKEKNWVEIDASWLKENNVERAFIASHNFPLQFAEESQFHVNCLRAGVKYVVRISTTHKGVRSDSIAYYQRAHWAIEAVLDSPPYQKLGWSSLQPHIFLPMGLWPAAEFIKSYRKTGKQDTLRIFVPKDLPMPLVDSDEVGYIAAHLLASDDITPYDHKRLVINGPEEITGEQIVKLVEQHIGTKVENVKYLDNSMIEQMAEQSENKQLVLAVAIAAQEQFASPIKDAPTSSEVLNLYAPKRTAAEVLRDLLE